MQLETKFHGILKYNEEDIITFKKGIPGFQRLKKFIFKDINDDNTFYLLHSIEDTSVGIILTNPFNIDYSYNIELDEATIVALKIKEMKEVSIYTTVTVDSNKDKITSNFVAPIIINNTCNLGEQIIVNNSKYKVKQSLL